MRSRISRLSWFARLALLLAAGGIAFDGIPSIARGQVAPSLIAQASPLPEAVYWKQDLFLIPYQFGSASEPAAAQAVWLFVSKDRGVTWQKISEAKPQVKAFNYRADGEGEYWFAIRTLDYQGRTWPAGAYQPELRVIVDTTIPRIEALRSRMLPSGSIEIAWICSDAHLASNSLVIEAQIDAVGTWQAVPIANLISTTPGAVTSSALGSTSSGQVQWQPPSGTRPVAIRATVLDRAKNAATYRAEVTLIAANGIAAPPLSATPNGASAAASNGIFGAPSGLPTPPNSSGWVSASAAPPPGFALPQAAATPVNQPWPANVTGRSPFRLSSVAVSIPNDGVTAYGSPPVITAPPLTHAPPPDNGATNLNLVEQRVVARHATTQHPAEGCVEQAPTAGPRFAALDPFRQASVKRLPALSDSHAQAAVNVPQPPPVGPVDMHEAPPAQTKRVGSRTFALEYDLNDMGRWGVSKVELWGTRDGGRTWQSFARDDDRRSPLVVTVDDKGVYGFRIAVDSAGSAAAAAPDPGDEPELWVSVDLHRPVIELTAIERGEGNFEDHLVFHWQAADDNLEPRPIALFYSSRPTGPWSAIATGLEDTGEYAWRVERHVPARFFVRIEARDTAGNLAAFQTRDPVDFAPASPSGSLRSAEPVGPTAIGSYGAYRLRQPPFVSGPHAEGSAL